MVVVKCWETRKNSSSEPFGFRYFVAESEKEAGKIAWEWENRSEQEEYYESHSMVMVLVQKEEGNELVPLRNRNPFGHYED